MTSAVSLTASKDINTIWVVRDRVRFSGQLEGTPVVMLEVQVPPGAGTPLHRHASPELFRVLSGEVVFTTFENGAERRMVGRPGDVLSVPSNAPHGYVNMSSEPAELLVVLDRAMEAFFRDIGSEVPGSGPPTPEEMERVIAACAKHGVSFVEVPAAA